MGWPITPPLKLGGLAVLEREGRPGGTPASRSTEQVTFSALGRSLRSRWGRSRVGRRGWEKRVVDIYLSLRVKIVAHSSIVHTLPVAWVLYTRGTSLIVCPLQLDWWHVGQISDCPSPRRVRRTGWASLRLPTPCNSAGDLWDQYLIVTLPVTRGRYRRGTSIFDCCLPANIETSVQWRGNRG